MSSSIPSSMKAGSSSKTGPGALTAVAELIKSGKAQKIVVLTGAGISTSAGIPDFRSPETGLYANLQALDLPFPEAVFELKYFRQNPKPFWTLAKELYPGKHYPTPTHYFMKLLEDHGILHRVWTQNIDTLEHQTQIAPHRIIEAHGSFAKAHCLECGEEVSNEYVISAGVRDGTVVICPQEGCGGLVKPDIVFFGEGLPDKFFDNLKDMSTCDLVIVIGTSLQVQPFSLLPHKASSQTPRLLINREAVGPFESLDNDDDSGEKDDLVSRYLKRSGGASRKNDLFWKGDADEGVRLLCEELGWGDELDRVIREGREDVERKWKEMHGLAEVGMEEKKKVVEGSNEEEIQSSKRTEEDKAPNLSPLSVKDGPSGEAEGADQAASRATEAGKDISKVLDESKSQSKEKEDEVEQLQKAIERNLKVDH